MTQEALILAIDNGTQSVRALLFDLQGQLVAKRFVALEPYMANPAGVAGVAEQWPQYYWQKLCEACQALWQEVPWAKDSLQAVTVTTQRGTLVCLDKQGKPLRPAIVWLDQRRATQVPPLGFFWKSLFRVAGVLNTVDYFQREAEVNWLSEHEPMLWNSTDRFLLLSGYLNYQLTGEFVDSAASQVGYVPFNFKRHAWASQWDWKWRALRILPSQLPTLYPPGHLLGVITQEAMQATGIPVGTAVYAAAADKACEVLGAGCLDNDVACISYGTTATINVTSTRYVEPLPWVPPYPAAIADKYNAEIQIYRGYWMVSWFKEQFGQPEQALAAASGMSVESLLDRLLAQAPPGAEGLMLQPFWSPGVRVPGPEARGCVVGFGDVHTRAHLYRAMLEGLAYALREGKERLEKRTHQPISHLMVAGGGSKSAAVMQMTANVFGQTAGRPWVSETSGLGAAICAAVGMGAYSDVNAAVKGMCRVGKWFLPQESEQQLYNEFYQRIYRRLYAQLKPIYKEMQSIMERHTIN